MRRKIQFINGLAGSAAVERLQQALVAYSQVAGLAAANPGVVDGVVGAKTVNAVAAVLPRLTSKISKDVADVLSLALPIAGLSADAMGMAKATVEQYASQIDVAIRALSIVTGPGGSPAAPPTGGTRVTGFPSKVAAIQAGTLTPGTTIYTFDAKINLYRHAKPIPQLRGLGAATYVETGTSTVAPTGGMAVSPKEYRKATGTEHWYETWWGMGSIAAGAAGAAFAGWRLLRR
jgi:hypothetical protein